MSSSSSSSPWVHEPPQGAKAGVKRGNAVNGSEAATAVPGDLRFPASAVSIPWAVIRTENRWAGQPGFLTWFPIQQRPGRAGRRGREGKEGTGQAV
jgi:hypothetical protein